MIDLRHEYIVAFTALAELKASGETNKDILQSYESLLYAISNDPRFRAETYIELLQGEKDEQESYKKENP